MRGAEGLTRLERELITSYGGYAAEARSYSEELWLGTLPGVLRRETDRDEATVEYLLARILASTHGASDEKPASWRTRCSTITGPPSVSSSRRSALARCRCGSQVRPTSGSPRQSVTLLSYSITSE